MAWIREAGPRGCVMKETRWITVKLKLRTQCVRFTNPCSRFEGSAGICHPDPSHTGTCHCRLQGAMIRKQKSRGGKLVSSLCPSESRMSQSHITVVRRVNFSSEPYGTCGPQICRCCNTSYTCSQTYHQRKLFTSKLLSRLLVATRLKYYHELTVE
ncbi:hypothetical protein Mapa_000660 [Marchantia paleacea]|nr:hypothetical protein Mapa_000660 [Marchantia paleacea]